MIEFTEDELVTLRFVVREGMKKSEKNIRGLRRKFGDAAVTTTHDRRQEHLHAVYEKIGG